MGQTGELRVGDRLATYVLNFEGHADLDEAWRTATKARRAFHDAIAPR